MKITIAERLRPYSHTPGTGCLIPGTWWQVQAFPTRLLMTHGSEIIDLSLKLTGPVKDFTLELDLERGAVWIFGKAQEGYFRLRLEASDSGLDLYAEKTPSSGLATSKGVLNGKDRLHFPVELTCSLTAHPERISFGNHKDQDWDSVVRRADLKEMGPPLLFLAQKTPKTPPHASMFPEKVPEKIEPLLEAFFQAHFKQILVPQLTDDLHQGIVLPKADPDSEPCFLIQQGAEWIRSLFFKQNERRLQILPNLPASTDCGRFIDIQCPGIGTLDFEWSKFFLRKVVLRATTPGEILFDLQKELKSFRVRKSRWEKGRRQAANEPLLLEAGKTYFLDNFQK